MGACPGELRERTSYVGFEGSIEPVFTGVDRGVEMDDDPEITGSEVVARREE